MPGHRWLSDIPAGQRRSPIMLCKQGVVGSSPIVSTRKSRSEWVLDLGVSAQQRGHRHVVRRRLPQRGAVENVPATPGPSRRTPWPSPPTVGHERAPGDRQAVGRPHLDRAAGEALRRHGRPWVGDEHDRPQLELPQPSTPARSATPHDQDQPGGRRAAPGEAPLQDPQEPEHRADAAPRRRDHPGRPAAGYVADRSDVRPAARRARRPSVALRGYGLVF